MRSFKGNWLTVLAFALALVFGTRVETSASYNPSAGATLAQVLATGNASGANDIAMASGQVVKWNADAGISRDAAGVLDFGTGASGSTAGSFKATNGTLSSALTTPSVTSTAGLNITSFSPIAGNTAGSSLSFSSGSGRNTGNGGNLQIQGGSSGLTAGTGGVISVTAGAGVGTNSSGGSATVTGGGATGAGAGGNVTLQVGTSSGSGGSGQISIIGGINEGFYITNATATIPGQVTISGGNVNGASDGATNAINTLITAPLASGNAAGGSVQIRAPFPGASGTTIQSVYDKAYFNGVEKALSTTTATSTTFAQLSCAITDSGVGCEVLGTIEAIDGAHHVGSIRFSMHVTAVNQNGTVTAACSTFTSGANGMILTGGTYTSLTTTTTATVSGTNVNLNVTPSWAAGTPTTVRLAYQVFIDGQGALTPQ